MNTFCTLLSFWSLRRFLEQNIPKHSKYIWLCNYSDNISMVICRRHLRVYLNSIRIDGHEFMESGTGVTTMSKVLEIPTHTHTYTRTCNLLLKPRDTAILPGSSDPVHFWQDSLLCFAAARVGWSSLRKRRTRQKLKLSHDQSCDYS